jgi:BRCT domain type II-containing protein
MLNKNIVFCFTGKGPLPRNQMTDIAIKAGASVTKSVTNETTILVIMDMNSQSTKAKKARENGIDLIGPQTFFLMCNAKQETNVQLSNNKLKVEIEKKIIAEQIKKPLLRKIIL